MSAARSPADQFDHHIDIAPRSQRQGIVNPVTSQSRFLFRSRALTAVTIISCPRASSTWGGS
ncbi:MAG: hypothetical protein P4M13_08890 [Alphaproteobacteria bacterium]|nr:hypothetical protein [Alphaproteobacteria bacterium]